jgi:hypothetical protein
MIPEYALCLLGEWKGDRLSWEAEKKIVIDENLSSRGVMEPAVADSADGGLLMILRGSNTFMTEKPGRKWFALSTDSGVTWSKPKPLRYDTGEDFYSPSSGSRLLRSSLNGKLYWAGNISPANPDGNSPRYPLVIAEVDEKKSALIKKSVTVIDTRGDNEPEIVQMSNFQMYEDRETKDFILTMCRILENGVSDRTEPSYIYRISLRS